MRHYIAALFFLTLLTFSSCQNKVHKQPKERLLSMQNPLVVIRTNLGDIELELFAEQAPLTVKNFLDYVDNKHYNNTIFHRVIDGFMIQGGGYTIDFNEKETKAPVRNEADNKVRNERGTIAMARTSDINSATAQFFINVVDNDFLNYKNPSPSAFGYCVFGKVIAGMETVDKIKKVKTSTNKGHQNVPIQNVVILEIVRKTS